jgi:hypothetical protein
MIRPIRSPGVTRYEHARRSIRSIETGVSDGASRYTDVHCPRTRRKERIGLRMVSACQVAGEDSGRTIPIRLRS